MDKQGIKNLKKRYSVWIYKTTKETLDKIERKFTQLEIDKFILKELKKQDSDRKAAKFIQEFQAYIQKKEKDARRGPEYYFLDLKLRAIERSIVKELGDKALAEIKALYEKEMIKRILKSTEEK